MRQILTLLLTLYFSNSFGQFAIVIDKDKFVNVRESGKSNSKVIDKLKNGNLIYCFDNVGNWTNIDYQKSEKNASGYIYKDRYKLVSSFPAFQISKKSNHSISLKKDSIDVSISQSKFNKAEHTFKYVKNYLSQIELIDNKPYWGTDGGMPTTQLEKISIKIGTKTISLPQSAFQGLYQPSLDHVAVNYDRENKIIYIQSANSDGAGSYLAIWKVENGIYKDRFIASGF